MTANIKKLLKNEYFQTAITIAVVAVITLGLYWAETNGYVAVVPTGSMCIPYGGACQGIDHPFNRTIHVGDMLIIQPINSDDYNSDYPNSDIIVYQNPVNPNPDLIVHRITSKVEVNGKLYFFTKGDGNPPTKWPNPVGPNMPDYGWYDSSWYAAHPEVPNGAVSEDLIVGKVILRIPWVGHFALFMQGNFGNNNYLIPIIVVLILLLIIIEFIVPLIKRKKHPDNQTTKTEQNEIPISTENAEN